MSKLDAFRPTINFRDLGGYEASDGRVVKPGLIFRSGGLYLLNEEELEVLKELNIKSIMELRTTGEVLEHPDPFIEGVNYVHYSGLEFAGGEEIDFSPEGMHRLGEGAKDQYEKICSYYLQMMFDNEAFTNLFKLLENEEVPLVFHCASGKDRTGVAAMLILLALGVPEDVVIQDYLLSNEYLQENIEVALKTYGSHNADSELAEKLTIMESGVLEETAHRVLQAIRERYGSYERYFEEEFGLNGAGLTRLRELYLEVPALQLPKRVRILFSSDVHGAISPYSYATGEPCDGGFARISSLVSTLKDANTILIDGGDTLEGSPLTSYHVRHARGELFPATRALAHIGYDFALLGNHDFDYGKDVLLRHLENCGAAHISGNVFMGEQAMAEPYTMIECAGISVALIGATTHVVPRWEPKKNIEGMNFVDAYDFVRDAVALVRANEQADVVVVAYHGGFERDPATGEVLAEDNCEHQAYRMLKEIEGIDVLLTGHQHKELSGVAQGASGHLVSYVQPGYKGRYLARVEITKEAGELIIKEGLMPVFAAPDEELLSLVAEEERACQLWLDTTLGRSHVDLSVEDTFAAELEKAPLVSFLNKVQLDATGADISATALFSGVTGFSHEISMRELVSTYIFSNTLTVKRVDGRCLREYLEQCARYFALDSEGKICRAPSFADPPRDENYDMLDGLEYILDVARPEDSRVVSLTRAGKEIAESDSFTLVVNNYRAAGGGGFPMIAAAETVAEYTTDMVELIACYLAKHECIDFDVENNVHVISSRE